MTPYQHHYTTPFIYPLLSKQAGTLIVDYSVKNILTYRAAPDFTGVLTVSFSVFSKGEERSREEVAIAVENGRAEIDNLLRRFEADGLGYVEVGMSADGPAFDRIGLTQGYGLFFQPERGAMTFGSDLKFAREAIIQQIAKYGQFCMHHPAAYVNRERNIGDSFLLINPYQQSLVVILASSRGKTIKRKVGRQDAIRVPLTEILEDGVWDTVMVTAKNRVTVFDIRHAYDDPHKLNNVDHLDFINGWSTHARRQPTHAARYFLRRWGRAAGVYFS